MEPLVIELVLIVIDFCSITDINGKISTVQAEFGKTVFLPCNCPVNSGSTVDVQWFKSFDSNDFVTDGKAITWLSPIETDSIEGYGITDKFSAIVYRANFTNQGWYRCIVSPVSDPDECIHDVNLTIYALPVDCPVIEHNKHTDGFNVTCSVTNVFPMIFPIISSGDENVTGEVFNSTAITEAGTFHTAVTRFFPQRDDMAIECLYSYLDFQRRSSLLIVESYTTYKPEEGDKMSRTPSGLWMIGIMVAIECVSFILILYVFIKGRRPSGPAGRKGGGDQDDKRAGEMEKESGETKDILHFQGLSWARISVIVIESIILIFTIAYLATARCLIETDGKQIERVLEE